MTTDTLIAVPGTDIDPFTREAIADSFRVTGQLREMAPMVYLEKYGVYATGRHKVAQAILQNWKGFTSTVKAFGPRAYIPAILVTQDPPDHTAVRTPIMKLFSPAALNTYREGFEREAKALVDRLLQTDAEVDGYKDIACAFVLKAFPDLLGLRPDGRENLMRFGDVVFNSTVPLNDIYKESLERNADAIAWVEKQCDRSAVTPHGMAAEIYAMGDRGEVQPEDALNLVRAMLAGGFDTTVLSITSALRCFSQAPEQWALLRSDIPALAKAAFEETLRFDPPSRFLGRGVVDDIEVEGVQLRQGDRVACFLNASGRDSRKWEDPDRFDIRRKAMGHVSFGFGVHTCLGQALARLEFQCLIAALAERIERIEPVGEPRRVINNQANGWDRLPLRLHAA